MPQYISSLIKEIKSQTDKPVIVYPNSGEHYDAESKTWNGTSAGETYTQRLTVGMKQVLS